MAAKYKLNWIPSLCGHKIRISFIACLLITSPFLGFYCWQVQQSVQSPETMNTSPVPLHTQGIRSRIIISQNTNEKPQTRRQNADDENTPWQNGQVLANKKVIILTYMRSGSTFVGELFRNNPDVAYWFEPVMGMYSALYYTNSEVYPIDVSHYTDSRRELPEKEHEYLRDNLLALLNCDYNNVAVDTMFEARGLGDLNGLKKPRYAQCLHSAMVKEKLYAATISKALRRCHSSVQQRCNINDFPFCYDVINATRHQDKESIQRLRLKSGQYNIAHFSERYNCMLKLERILNRCVHHVRSECVKKPFNAVKVIRVSMETIERILHADSSVKVIHLLRDPRGIVTSRRKISLLSRMKRSSTEPEIVTEAKLLCDKIEHDIEVRKQLEQKWSRNLLEVRYEDMAQEPLLNYHKIYEFLGIEKSPLVDKWIKLSTSGRAQPQKQMSAFSTVRKNSTATAYSWVKQIQPVLLGKINSHCLNLIHYLNESVDIN